MPYKQIKYITAFFKNLSLYAKKREMSISSPARNIRKKKPIFATLLNTSLPTCKKPIHTANEPNKISMTVFGIRKTREMIGASTIRSTTWAKKIKFSKGFLLYRKFKRYSDKPGSVVGDYLSTLCLTTKL